jgi:hypothetical protein
MQECGIQVSKNKQIYGLFFIIGILDSPGPPDISSFLNVGQLAHWLISVDLPLSRDLLRILYQRLFESSLRSSSGLQQLQDMVPILQKQLSSQLLDVKTLEPSVALLQVINKVMSMLPAVLGHTCCVFYIS